MKKSALIVGMLGKLKAKPAATAPGGGEGEPDDSEMAAHTAAQAFLDAVEKKDAGALVEAFKNLDDACGEYGPNEEAEPGEGG